jgi:Carboxypeptidase regulatory-like domain/Putative zinc-finger
MQHLDAQKLSAHLDQALTGSARAEVERHLESCAECRDAFAALLAQDRALDSALTHDPGNAYFDTFAARVEDRIRAAGLRGAQERHDRARGQGLWTWWTSPRRLAVTSAVAATIVGIGVVLLVARETPPGVHGDLQARRIDGPPPALMPAPSSGANESNSRSSGAAASRLDGRAKETVREGEMSDGKAAPMAEMHTIAPNAGAPTPGGVAAPSRAYAVRDEHGEVVRAQSDQRFAPPPADKQALASGSKLQKPLAAPMAQTTEEKTKAESFKFQNPPSSESDALAKKDAANAPTRAQAVPSAPSPVAQAPAPAAQEPASAGKTSWGTIKNLARGGAEVPRTEGGQPMLCGDVIDLNGRPVANAQITLVDLSRVSTSNDQGRFCIPAPQGSQALSVMAVGFEPVNLQVVVAGEAPTVRVTLKPVSALGSGFALVPGGRPDSAGLDRKRQDAARLVADAENESLRGLEQRSASRLDSAAGDFERALKSLGDSPHAQAIRYRLAETRVQAYRISPNGRRARAAQTAVNALLTHPGTAAARDSALHWQEQIPR